MSEQPKTVLMFVNGQAMSGGSINFALQDAKFLGAVKTAAKYRFYSVRDEFPGLWPVEQDGQAIPGELYELPYAQLRESLLPNEPSELELGVIELEDGSGSLSMKMREEEINSEGVVEITDQGGWLKYLAAKQA
ncbi:allophanate hydrolase-related protein [Vreelandella zhanjiangensis]|uniref:allophanate hydrolase-related protein n=1 Tax=Vreelandella zhanjiangensis TaxID=1121960 RepID=UPI0003611772|nr:gamma-glutamylcyclotransferase [Halomonas zhanjiangensis]